MLFDIRIRRSEMDNRVITKQYIDNTEFNSMVSEIVQKYPEKYKAITINRICGVKWITNEKSPTEAVWKLEKVKMPMALHCPYDWYVTFRSADWDSWDEKEKLAMVVNVMEGLKGLG